MQDQEIQYYIDNAILNLIIPMISQLKNNYTEKYEKFSDLYHQAIDDTIKLLEEYVGKEGFDKRYQSPVCPNCGSTRYEKIEKYNKTWHCNNCDHLFDRSQHPYSVVKKWRLEYHKHIRDYFHLDIKESEKRIEQFNDIVSKLSDATAMLQSLQSGYKLATVEFRDVIKGHNADIIEIEEEDN